MYAKGSIHGVTSRDFLARGHGEETPNDGIHRLFPGLDPIKVRPDGLHKLAEAMIESGSSPSGDNPCIPAAYTYFGQFVDHDLTFVAVRDDNIVTNLRTPAFDLDCVYGGGPQLQPYMYSRDNPALFETGATEVFTGGARVAGIQGDLPRAFNRYALIADPRNDENLIVAQLHLAFLHFHNEVVRWLMASGAGSTDWELLFAEARRIVVEHYQHIVRHDYLPRIVSAMDICAVEEKGSILASLGKRAIPVEFSVAAYRFGHSMVRSNYNFSNAAHNASLDQLFLQSGRSRPSGVPVNAPIMNQWVATWARLLALTTSENAFARRIDPYLAEPLSRVPLPSGLALLAEINLERGFEFGLPPGQSVAEVLGVRALTEEELGRGPDGEAIAELGLLHRTPLWYYILKEAAELHGGRHLGPVGGRIVADVFLGLMEFDADSAIRKPGWRPTLPAEHDCHFTLADMLRLAGALGEGNERGRNLNKSSGRTVCPACYTPQ